MIGATITFVRASIEWKIVPTSEYKFFYDTVSIGEAAAVLLAKAEVDSYQFTDVAIVHANKVFGHSISFADDFAKVVAYSRQFTDGFALDDTAQVDKSINANKGIEESEVIMQAKESQYFMKNCRDKSIEKSIYIKDRLLNLIIK